MRKSVSPVVAIVVLVVVVLVAAWFFAKAARTKKVQFIPGQGIVDRNTGRVVGPSRRGQGRGRQGTQQDAQRAPRGR